MYDYRRSGGTATPGRWARVCLPVFLLAACASQPDLPDNPGSAAVRTPLPDSAAGQPRALPDSATPVRRVLVSRAADSKPLRTAPLQDLAGPVTPPIASSSSPPAPSTPPPSSPPLPSRGAAAPKAGQRATPGKPLVFTPAPSVSVPLASAPPSSAAADPGAGGGVSVAEEAPFRYVVQPGDTLWSISKRFLDDPWQWPEVWYINDEVANPHLIFPGDVLTLIQNKGRAVVTREAPPAPTLNVSKVSPQVRRLPLEQAIPTIPIDAIREFLRGPRLVTADELARAPYVLAFEEDHIVGGSGNTVYVQDLAQSTGALQYAVIRKGEAYRDPDDGALLGYEAMPVAEADIMRYGEPATGQLARSFREALIGDHLLPIMADEFRADFLPHAPQAQVDGKIISVYDGVSQIGQFQIVAMNRGSQHGLEPGHVLDIFQVGSLTTDPYTRKRVRLPDEFAGQLMVFRVTPRVSFGLVMEVFKPVHRLDRVENPNLRG